MFHAFSQLQALTDGYSLSEVEPLFKLALPNLNVTYAGTGPCPTEPLIISNATDSSAFAPAPGPARANATANGAFAGPMPGFPAAVAAAAGAVVLSMLL